MSGFKLNNISQAIVFGAGHGIGLSLVKEILKNNPSVKIYVSFRVKEKATELLQLAEQYYNQLYAFQVDPIKEESWNHFITYLKEKTNFLDLVINCIGVLYDSNCKPEKSLNQISLESLVHSFSVNSAVTPLLAKHIYPLLRNSELALFATLSAKVGSIKDNKLGGWYGYRASKSAANMFLKTIAIEFSNRGIPCVVLSIHPGTTRTELSEPYIKNSKLKIHSSEETARNILNVIEAKSLADSGKFFSWDGSSIPW